MRLHQLQITAFGPFAGTVEVDFDELSDAGLFLLSGPTGAGKSSVLDAVCFGLYGDVPGDRAVAKRLRSDLAEPTVAPRVILEATIAGRRIRLTRSPAWRRPKKRTTGTTPVPAKVLAEEWIHGEWVVRSTRLDETGQLIGDLVGLTMAQFCQVAMLPQGQFQAFLRAKPDDRQRLLERLFRTHRFGQIEAWLREHRLALRRQSLDHEALVRDQLSRISEAADVDLPPDFEGDLLATEAGTAAAQAWADSVASAATQAHLDAGKAAAVAEQAHAMADRALRLSVHLREQQSRFLDAQQRRCVLDELEPEVSALRVEWERGTSAVALRPLADLSTGTHAAVQAAEAAFDEALDASGLVDDTAEALAQAERAARDELERVRLVESDAEALAAAEHTLRAYAAQLESLDQAEATDSARSEWLPVELARLRAELQVAQEADRAHPAAAEAVVALIERLTAARRVVVLKEELVAAEERRRAAVDLAQQRVEAVQLLREKRLAGMAAEIAGELAAGCHCPVCGSAEHPSPAQRMTDAITPAQERAAQREADSANAERHLREEHVRDLQTQMAVLTAAAGGNATELSTDLAVAQAHATTLAETAAPRASLEAQVSGAAAELTALAEARHARDKERAGIESAARHLRENRADLASRVSAVIGDDTRGIKRLLTQRQDHLDRVLAVTRTRDRLQARRQEHAGAAAALADALADSILADVADVRVSWRSDADLRRLAERLRDHDDERVLVRAALADADLLAAAMSPAPDTTALARVRAEAHAEATRRATEKAKTATRAERLEGLVAELAAALRDWEPLRLELATATGLSSFVDGKSVDNRWQMRLSAYVLSHRLAQVVAAANERLVTMSDRRYSLERSDERGAGETRGGLSLLVRDDWTGEARDPATLSGGETFVVSLALALGLADVLTQQSQADASGDGRLGTLFVDEGFGSLDADTLDDVMDTLDGLREGGRVVGVVSHVAEMRDRIPVRLEVIKGRRGSRLG